jgi:hypothetical protein
MSEEEFYAELNRLLPDDRTGYVGWDVGDKSVVIDGKYTAADLRIIADLLDKAAG